MLELLTCAYAFLVWLIFIKLKLLPWNIKSQVGVVAFGAAALALLVFTINVTAPSTGDVRVTNYVVEIVPRVTGLVALPALSIAKIALSPVEATKSLSWNGFSAKPVGPSTSAAAFGIWA